MDDIRRLIRSIFLLHFPSLLNLPDRVGFSVGGKGGSTKQAEHLDWLSRIGQLRKGSSQSWSTNLGGLGFWQLQKSCAIQHPTPETALTASVSKLVRAVSAPWGLKLRPLEPRTI